MELDILSRLDIANIIVYSIFCHFIADFVMQSHEMAINKSKSFKWLSYHILAYGLVMFFMMFLFLQPHNDRFTLFEYWWLINVFSHWITDFFTSKLNAWLWKKGEVHWFFVGVGLDQTIHLTILIYTTFYFIL